MASRSPPKLGQTTRDAADASPARKLKVFQATIGFYDTVVAMPSQAAALRAWGTSQNMFADGVARLTDDEKAREAALAQPGVVLRRAVGSSGTFGLHPHLPSLPDLPPSRTRAAKSAPSPRAPKPKPADRTALDEAEAALARLKEEGRAARATFAARRQALDDEEAASEARADEAQTRAREKLERERKAYVAAGGRAKARD